MPCARSRAPRRARAASRRSPPPPRRQWPRRAPARMGCRKRARFSVRWTWATSKMALSRPCHCALPELRASWYRHGMRGLVLLLASLTIVCASPQKKAQPVQAGAPIRDGRRLMIIGINDTHGALLAIPPPRWASAYTKSDIGGADWFAGWTNAIRADYGEKGDEVLILDAGDE